METIKMNKIVGMGNSGDGEARSFARHYRGNTWGGRRTFVSHKAIQFQCAGRKQGRQRDKTRVLI